MAIVRVKSGGALATAVGKVSGLALSENGVGFGVSVTLTWEAAADGAGNPVSRYDVYRDGVFLRRTTQTECVVRSPEENGSAVFTVQAMGTIGGFDGEMSESVTLTSHVTAVGAVTGVSVSANDVGFSTEVVLRWTAAEGGINNPVRAYEIYRATAADGVYSALESVTGTSVSVTSPASNMSYIYKVKAIGSVNGFDGALSDAATLTSRVTAPGVPGNVRLNVTDVALSKAATLSWSAATAGINNAVASYHVYRNGAYLSNTTGTSLQVTASATAGGKYTYTVYAIGSVTGYNSAASAGVTLTAHGVEHADTYFTQNGTFTVPAWAERMAVTVIGGGGGGGRGGYSYGHSDNRWPGGGGGGGTGQIMHTTLTSLSAGATYAVTVGGGGGAGAAGGASSFGSILSAAGGSGGASGGESPFDQNGTAHGGNGGSGGIGGAGGGAGRGGYSTTLGNGGGTGASSQAWQGWASGEWYVFRDASTGRRLGMSGAGGRGYETERHAGQGKTTAQLPGTCYGGGGRGGDNQRNQEFGNEGGGSGLVAVRCYRYVG